MGASRASTAPLLAVLALAGCEMQAPGDRVRVKAEPSEYCELLQEDAPPTLCRRLAELPSRLETGVAAFNPPPKMKRGETVTVEFALSRGSDPEAARVLVAEPNGRMQVFRPKIGRFMAAELAGDGFEVSPAGPQEQDLFLSGAAVWRWQVKALRADRHRLTLSAWVKVKLPDNSLKPVWFRTVSRQVAVPVRFFPDRIEDFIDDSGRWLGRLDKWVKALAALVAALSSLALGVRHFGRKKPDA